VVPARTTVANTRTLYLRLDRDSHQLLVECPVPISRTVSDIRSRTLTTFINELSQAHSGRHYPYFRAYRLTISHISKTTVRRHPRSPQSNGDTLLSGSTSVPADGPYKRAGSGRISQCGWMHVKKKSRGTHLSSSDDACKDY
jgi:hypothetical protein